nr:EAL domain-containing protein [Petropleomorpha daqingensis]
MVQPVPLLAVTVALVGVVSLAASATTAWLLAGVSGLLLLAFRAYATVSDRHLHLDRLYRFSQSLGQETEIGQVMATVLGEAREVLHAERASAAFVAADGGIVARVRLGPGAETSRSEDRATDADAWVLESVVGGGPLVMPRATRDPRARGWLDQYGMRDALAVPLAGAAGITGVLVVADRLGDVRTFGPEDAVLLETVANHAALALRNGELIGQLRHDAAHDALTGLPNRRAFQAALGGALEQVADGNAPGAAVLIADLDDFQEVNDALGHQQGDRLLVEISDRLAAELGEEGVVGRLNGDEFAVLVPATADEEDVLAIARRLLRVVERPVLLDGQEVAVGAAVGIALAPRHTTDAAVLLKRAERAMHEAKASSRQIRVYEAGLGHEGPRRLTLAADLRVALRERTLAVHVQPQAEPGTGAVLSAEALVRWSHPELGPVSPEEFIPIAERNGLIGELTGQVLDGALAASARWRAAGQDLGIAVNLSARSLLDDDLVDSVARALHRHGVPPARLTLEVTESSVMSDPARAVAVLHELRDLGVRLSVDDFGTGYSSLSYLKRLPVQEVKIDRSFVIGLREQGDDVGIVRAIVDLGRHLGLEVVAEGVEDGDTQTVLSGMGCDLIQGYHLGRPMPAEEFLPWLAARAAAARPQRLSLA